MDVSWWGVDDAGEIGLFETGEEGCLPRIAGHRIEPAFPWDELFSKRPYDDKGVRAIPIDGAPLAALCTATNLVGRLERHVWHCVVRFSSEEDIVPVEDPEAASAFRFAGPDVVVYYSYKMPLAKLAEAAKMGSLIGLVGSGDGLSQLGSAAIAQGIPKEALASAYERNPDLHWLLRYVGIHAYQHELKTDCYEAYYRPLAPVKLDAFSIEDLLHTGLVPLPGVRFADTAALQPMALLECSRWGGEYWAGADGSLHLQQSFKGGSLLDADRVPVSDEMRRRLVVRPIGVPPVPVDYAEWQRLHKARKQADALELERRMKTNRERDRKRPSDP